MSNALAIAATTSTLRNLLFNGIPALDSTLGDLEVSTQPPDLARKNVTKPQLNLFLYQIVYNATWRNLDMPRQVRAGETGMPPLAVNLRYLMTTYGRGEIDVDAVSHRVLAAAMSVLHDHAMLGRDEIRNALTDNDLADQIERVRLTPQPLSIEELSKLWTAFQTQYRLSTAFEAAVVLIDSRVPVRTPLPVINRGKQDRGVTALATAAPVLDALQLPHSQPAVRLGEDIIVIGRQLTIENAMARFSNPRLDDPVDVVPLPGDTPDTLRLHLGDSGEDADAPSRWAPGIYTVALRVQSAGVPMLVSNELAVAIAPTITLASSSASAGTISLGVDCTPRIRDGQRVFLLFGDRMIAPTSLTNPADTHQPSALVFDIKDVLAGTYTVRLRVDGADSIPVDYTGAVPAFAGNQQVKVT